MNARWRRRISAIATIVMTAMWPVSQFTWARDEPPTVLALSWLALILSTATLWATTDVRVKEEEKGEA